MVSRCGWHTALTATGEWSDLDTRFSIPRNAQFARISIGGAIDRVYLLEDSVGLATFLGK